MSSILILFALILGLCGWIAHLIYILQSFRSSKKGTVLLDFNHYHELYFETMLIIILIIFVLYVIMSFI